MAVLASLALLQLVSSFLAGCCSLYGCVEARKILKIKEDGRDFNPSNCLGDIMTLYRGANARFQISSQMPDAHVIFRTEDAALESLHSWMNTRVTGVTADGTMMKTTCEAPEKLFPALYKKGTVSTRKSLLRCMRFWITSYNV
ncbi:hypothetical protein [Enterobacter hormaechei]|uniref:hypothetical protein n=1 Tax=Enterobacter hormaechei TaxID=158836 RepID=UPI0011DCD339|nr:hypothetical protein [Enterobacter hormaechei]